MLARLVQFDERYGEYKDVNIRNLNDFDTDNVFINGRCMLYKWNRRGTFNCRCLMMDEIIKVIAKTTKLMYYLIE